MPRRRRSAPRWTSTCRSPSAAAAAAARPRRRLALLDSSQLGLGEGGTPLVRLPTLELQLGVGELWAKLELCNPTGSYKDRIAAATVRAVVERGLRGWVATSSGNGGSAFAAYGARAGLRGILLIDEHVPREKLVPALMPGTHVFKVAGTGAGGTDKGARRLFEVATAIARDLDLYLAVTAHKFNDLGMRACDAIAREILDREVVPDAVYVPTSGGGLVAAVARGFLARGSSTAAVCAQPAGSAPIVDFLRGRLERPVVNRSDTTISGLQLADPPDGALAADLIRQTGGWGTSAPDEAIHRAQLLLARHEGIFVEPAGAAGLAALQADVRAGRAFGAARIVLLLTGSGLKDLRSAERIIAPPPRLPVDAVHEAAVAVMAHQP